MSFTRLQHTTLQHSAGKERESRHGRLSYFKDTTWMDQTLRIKRWPRAPATLNNKTTSMCGETWRRKRWKKKKHSNRPRMIKKKEKSRRDEKKKPRSRQSRDRELRTHVQYIRHVYAIYSLPSHSVPETLFARADGVTLNIFFFLLKWQRIYTCRTF